MPIVHLVGMLVSKNKKGAARSGDTDCLFGWYAVSKNKQKEVAGGERTPILPLVGMVVSKNKEKELQRRGVPILLVSMLVSKSKQKRDVGGEGTPILPLVDMLVSKNKKELQEERDTNQFLKLACWSPKSNKKELWEERGCQLFVWSVSQSSKKRSCGRRGDTNLLVDVLFSKKQTKKSCGRRGDADHSFGQPDDLQKQEKQLQEERHQSFLWLACQSPITKKELWEQSGH